MASLPWMRYLSSVPHAPAPLSPTQRATLEAAARRIVPHAFEDPARGDALLRALVVRIGGLPARKQRDVRLALTLFGSRASALTSGILPRPFLAQRPERQDRHLERWLTSSVAAFRTIAQAIRRLVIFTEYTTAAAHR
ncbi:MAG: hypothetical protein RLZZ63_385, partial [Gemmatimonadota bacterium]